MTVREQCPEGVVFWCVVGIAVHVFFLAVWCYPAVGGWTSACMVAEGGICRKRTEFMIHVAQTTVVEHLPVWFEVHFLSL